MTSPGKDSDAVVSASDAVRAIARNDPNRLALEVGDTSLTYAELDAASESAAQTLLAIVEHGGHVVLHIERTAELLIASMAVVRAGLVSVPVDPTAPREHLSRVCREAEAALVLSDCVSADDFEIAVRHPRSLVGPRPESWEDRPLPPYVAIAFTSGSTGTPKGIMIGPRQRPSGAGGVDNSVYGSFEPALRAGLIAAGTTNVVETTVQSYLLLGATLVAYEIRQSGISGFGAWLRHADVFGFTAIPTVLRHLLSTLEPDEVIESVRMVFLSGETSTWEDVARLRRHLHPDAVIVSVFGTTETGPCLSVAIDQETTPESGPLPLGTPMPDRIVELVGPDGIEVPDGVIGEILVTGPETSLGYWRRPEETATTFMAVDSERRRVRTGDLGRRLPDGVIEHHGRLDHVVKIAGNRVELGEVEAALRHAPHVVDAACTTYLDGVGQQRLAAFVVPERGRAVHPAALRLELARTLPGPLVPDRIDLLAALPLLPGGKVDRRRLAVNAAQPRAGSDDAAPQTELQRSLLRIWSGILGVKRLSIDDDFFALGGDSLRGARAIVELERAHGVDLPVSTLVEAPTIRALAELIQARRAHWTLLVPVRMEGSRPPLFVVHDGTGDVVFAHPIARRLPADVPVYGLRGQAVTGTAIPERSIEALAERYLTTIRAVRPAGPYLLYGMSAGGTIAFEMARQLRAAGEDAPLLALGDTPGPGGHQSEPPPFPFRSRLGRRIRELRERPARAAASHALHLLRRQLRSYARAARAALTRERRRYAAEELLVEEAAANGAPVPSELRTRLALRVYGMLAVQYEPAGPFDGTVTLLQSRQPPRWADTWRRHSQVVDVVEIDGEHTQFGREPVVGEVGDVLRRRIEAVLTARQ